MFIDFEEKIDNIDRNIINIFLKNKTLYPYILNYKLLLKRIYFFN